MLLDFAFLLLLEEHLNRSLAQTAQNEQTTGGESSADDLDISNDM